VLKVIDGWGLDDPRGNKMKEALACVYGSGSVAADVIEGIGERLAFVGFPSRQATKQISGSAEEALKGIAILLEQMVVGAVEKRTAAEFRAVQEETFQNYARLMFSLGCLIRAVVPANVIERVTAEGLCEMEADFRDHALNMFGSSIRDQAIFTVWTLRKISDLGQKVAGNPVPENLREQDKQYATMFSVHGLRARFNLDCLLYGIRTQRPIYPEVLEAISGGLRSAVNAYAWIRQAADLRVKQEEPALEFVDLDDEDRTFVEASAYDMARECA
jgi:hypothetical protein